MRPFTPAMMPARRTLAPMVAPTLDQSVAPPGRGALLVDLENFLHCAQTGGWVEPADADRRLRRLLAEAGDVQFRLGVCIDALVVFYLGRSAIVGTDSLPLRVCDESPDAADRMLLEAGDHLVGRGFTRFTVASGDHAFCELAELARVDVVVTSERMLSGALAARARKVRVVA